MDFDNSGGHAVLLMKAGELPTLLNADFTFRSEELVKGDQVGSQKASTCTVWERIPALKSAAGLGNL